MSTHIVHIDEDTDFEHGFRTAAEQLAAEIPEQKLRKLFVRQAMLIYMLSYIEHKGHADHMDEKVLAVLRECFAHAELPLLGVKLSPTQK